MNNQRNRRGGTAALGDATHMASLVATLAFGDIGLAELDVFPGVFNPETSLSGKFLARVLARHPGLFAGAEVLDMACGTGILGIVCLLHGARSVLCTDVSPSAARNAIHNAAKHGLTIEATAGDLFAALDPLQRYDLIVFNPPGFEGVPATEEEAHVFCPYAVIDSCYRTARRFLKPGGAILSATSDLHDPVRSPTTMAEQHGYSAELVSTGTFDRGQQYAYLVRPIITLPEDRA